MFEVHVPSGLGVQVSPSAPESTKNTFIKIYYYYFMPLNSKIIKQRNKIIKENNFKLLKIFDTNEHEDYKDVVLIYDPKDKKKKVLRVGEHRTKNFLHNGYKGKYLIVPKIYSIITAEHNKYEIEEFVKGELLVNCLSKPTADKPIDDRYLELLIKSFWEFQTIGKKINLPKQEVLTSKVKKHLAYAYKVMDGNKKQRAENLFKNKKVINFFKNSNYPCKWKFAVDNLILTTDSKIGFIDLARVGKRFWGYDLGWIFWPLWFHFPIQEYKKTKEHLNWLENLFKKIDEYKPKNVKKVDIIFYGYLIILERVIGTMFDVAANISHAQKITKKKRKMKAFIKFLNELLELTLDKIKNYKK